MKLPGALSQPWSSLITGVPQGGVVFLALFNVHIDDIRDGIPSDLLRSSVQIYRKLHTKLASPLTQTVVCRM